MRNSGDTEMFTDYQRVCPCTLGKNAIDFEDISTFLTSEGVDRTLSLSTEINNAKKEYSPNMTDIGMVEVLTDNLFKKKYGQVYTFRQNTKHNTHVEALRANLKEKLAGYIAPFFEEPFIPDNQGVEPIVPVREPEVTPSNQAESLSEDLDDTMEEEEGGNKWGWLGSLTSLSLLVIGLGLGLLLYQRTKKYGKLQDLYKNEKEKSRIYEKLLAQRDAEKEVYVNKIAAKNKKLEDLEMLLAGRAAAPNAVPLEVDEEPLPPIQAEEFYLSTPNNDGSFNDNGKSKIFKPTASLYHFIVRDVENHIAEFSFVNEESAVVRALNYPDTCLLPACEELNAHDAEARAIQTERTGVVQLINDKWVLKEKAQIIYV